MGEGERESAKIAAVVGCGLGGVLTELLVPLRAQKNTQ